MKARHESRTENLAEQAEPILNNLFGGWSLVPVGGNDYVSRILDMTCGINHLLLYKGSTNVYGVSSHTQYGKNYRTFSVPKKEYEKLSEAFANGGMRPYYTMHVYMDGSRIIGLGLIKTVDLMQFIVNDLAEEKERYYVCGWDNLREAGCNVMEYSADEPDDEDEEDEEEDDGELYSMVDIHGVMSLLDKAFGINRKD